MCKIQHFDPQCASIDATFGFILLYACVKVQKYVYYRRQFLSHMQNAVIKSTASLIQYLWLTTCGSVWISQLSTHHFCVQFIPKVIADCPIRIVIAHFNSTLESSGAIHETNIAILTTCMCE